MFVPDLVIPPSPDPDPASKTVCPSLLTTPLNFLPPSGSWMSECGARALWSAHLRAFLPPVLTHLISVCACVCVCVCLSHELKKHAQCMSVCVDVCARALVSPWWLRTWILLPACLGSNLNSASRQMCDF